MKKYVITIENEEEIYRDFKDNFKWYLEKSIEQMVYSEIKIEEVAVLNKYVECCECGHITYGFQGMKGMRCEKLCKSVEDDDAKFCPHFVHCSAT